MKQNGMYALDFKVPALDGGPLIYLRGAQFLGRLVALCFFLTLASPLMKSITMPSDFGRWTPRCLW